MVCGVRWAVWGVWQGMIVVARWVTGGRSSGVGGEVVMRVSSRVSVGRVRVV